MQRISERFDPRTRKNFARIRRKAKISPAPRKKQNERENSPRKNYIMQIKFCTCVNVLFNEFCKSHNDKIFISPQKALLFKVFLKAREIALRVSIMCAPLGTTTITHEVQCGSWRRKRCRHASHLSGISSRLFCYTPVPEELT